jgi:hypothetical protein
MKSITKKLSRMLFEGVAIRKRARVKKTKGIVS